MVMSFYSVLKDTYPQGRAVCRKNLCVQFNLPVSNTENLYAAFEKMGWKGIPTIILVLTTLCGERRTRNSFNSRLRVLAGLRCCRASGSIFQAPVDIAPVSRQSSPNPTKHVRSLTPSTSRINPPPPPHASRMLRLSAAGPARAIGNIVRYRYPVKQQQVRLQLTR